LKRRAGNVKPAQENLKDVASSCGVLFSDLSIDDLTPFEEATKFLNSETRIYDFETLTSSSESKMHLRLRCRQRIARLARLKLPIRRRHLRWKRENDRRRLHMRRFPRPFRRSPRWIDDLTPFADVTTIQADSGRIPSGVAVEQDRPLSTAFFGARGRAALL